MPSDFFGACCASFAGASGVALGFAAGGVEAGGVEAGVEGGDVVAGVFCAPCAFVAVMGELATAAFTSLEVRAASRPASATMLSSAELFFEELSFEEPLFDGAISLDCSASSEVGVRIGWFEPLAVGTDDASAAGDAEAISVLPASARINHQPAPSDATAAAPSRMNCVPKR
jgi:hypothetical protein